METFEYSVIRFVPKVERGEFINIGVILFSKRLKFLGLKYKVDDRRLLSLDEEVDLDLIKSYLNSWALISAGSEDGGEIASFDMPYRFRWLTASKSTIIQASNPHPGLCDDPQRMLDQLFEKYVG